MKQTCLLDSGASKTDWIIVENDRQQYQGTTHGFNAFQDSYQVFEEIYSHIKMNYSNFSPQKIVHYGSGFTPKKVQDLSPIVQKLFPNADISLQSDLMATAMAADGPAWIGILGTGSNLAYFNGTDISKHIPSLGWLMGDEGGGKDITKCLLKKYCRNQLSQTLQREIEAITLMSRHQILSSVLETNSLKNLLQTLGKELPILHRHEEVVTTAQLRIGEFLKLLPTDIGSDYLYLTGSLALAHSGFIRSTMNERGVDVGIDQYPLYKIAKKMIDAN